MLPNCVWFPYGSPIVLNFFLLFPINEKVSKKSRQKNRSARMAHPRSRFLARLPENRGVRRFGFAGQAFVGRKGRVGAFSGY